MCCCKLFLHVSPSQTSPPSIIAFLTGPITMTFLLPLASTCICECHLQNTISVRSPRPACTIQKFLMLTLDMLELARKCKQATGKKRAGGKDEDTLLSNHVKSQPATSCQPCLRVPRVKTVPLLQRKNPAHPVLQHCGLFCLAQAPSTYRHLHIP